MVNNLKVLAIYIQGEVAPSPAIQDQIEEFRKLGISVEVMPINTNKKITYFKVAWRVFLLNFFRRGFDIIHAYYGHSGLVAKTQFRIPVVTTFQGTDILGGKEGQMGPRDGKIGGLAAKLTEGIIVMSEQMQRLSGRPDAVVIPFGINTDIFNMQPQTEAREALGLSQDVLYVLFPWSPDRVEKNFHIAKAAVEILRDRGERVEILPIFSKPRETIARYMNACDAMVLVSDHEGAPVAVREAMACGLPIVSVDVGDVAEVLEGVTPGCIVPRTAEAVADALHSILEQRARSSGPEKIATLDASWSARQVLPIYEKVLKGKKPVVSSGKASSDI